MSDKGLRVYTLDASDDILRDESAKAMVNAFLEAHHINPKSFIVGTRIDVFRRNDSYWLETWQALEEFPLCESCPGCIKQERVVLPLAAGVPVVPGAWFDKSHVCDDALDVVEASDAVAAAESAYRAALVSLSLVTRSATLTVHERAEDLQNAKWAAQRQAQEDRVGEGRSVVKRLQNLDLLPKTNKPTDGEVSA